MIAETLMRNGDGDDMDSRAWQQVSDWTIPQPIEHLHGETTNLKLRRELGVQVAAGNIRIIDN